MAGFKIDFFKGMRPKISATKLRPGEAKSAQNVKLGSGDLEPIPEKTTVQAVGSGRASRTIYLFDNLGSPLWFEWDDYVDVVRGPVKDDSLERTYYTGDTTGNGAPKLTTTALADLGGGGPYPEAWWYVGVPPPALAPSVTPTDLPEDKPANLRIAKNFKSNELEVDEVQWTEYPGTGTRNQTWRLESAATGSIAFAVLPGTSFRITSIININKVTLESATEPGITMRTLNSDKTTVNDWHPMDEQGTTQKADFIGWRVPVDMEVTIPGHNLNLGDVIVVSAINNTPQFFSALTTDFYEQAWDAEIQINEAGSSYYQVTDARLSASAVSGATPWQISGSFYYDVDRAASTASELEDRSYVYTYVNSLGEEGPPSPPSTSTPLLDGQSVLISEMSLPPTIGYDIVKMRLYRTNSTEAGTEFQFIKEFNVSRTTRDDVLSSSLGEVISTTTWDPPDPGMQGMMAMPNGMLVGFKGKQVFFCEPYFPHAWPAEYDQAVEYNIVGLAAFGNSIAILTEGWPYIATGSHPRNINLRPIKINQACLNKESIASDGDRVYYASPDGLVELGVNGIRIATEPFLDKDDWATYSPSNMVSEFYEGRYYGFYDFDVTAVPPVITAEVSGTITDADESNIIDGGRTILLQLTNDLWVAAGTSFDNQRQNIIDGLTASTTQTLGWNNIIRDSELGVSDVVRTSDTLVTITLPAAPGYAISSAEVIQPVIPASALLASNAALNTGSTFTVEPQAASATVTMSGTAAGAAESAIVSGGDTIILTLSNDTWISSADGFDAHRQEIIDGLQATTNEQDGWNDNVTQLIPVSSVVRTSDLIVTITLPAVANYSITANETIRAIVPHEALVTQQDVDAVSSNSIGIVATGVATALFSGTAVDAGVTENQIIAGGETIIITLTNDTWIAAGTGPIGTTAQSEALVAALIAQVASPTNGWDNTVQAAVDSGDLVRTSSTVATITLPAVAGYSIASNETIGAIIPNAILTTSTEDLTVSNTFGITSQAPVTCALSGTVTGSINELDIVAGGETIILTLSDDTWVTAGATFDAQRQNIIDGLTAASSPTNGWNNELRDGSLSVSDVVRTSDTIVTITLPADAQYDISSMETITATVPATALTISALGVVASPTFTVAVDAATTAAITGTLDTGNNDDVIAGGKTIIITLANDTWVAAGATFNAQRQAIIDGLDAASSPAGGWNNKVRDVIGVSTVVRTSSTVVTITLPAVADYDINAAEVITVTVPAAALVESAIAVTGSPTVDVAANATQTGRILLGYDGGSLGGEGTLETSFFDLDYYTQYRPVIGSSGDDNYPYKMAYSEAENVWVGFMSLAKQLYSSTDDGDTWTVRATTGTPSTPRGGMYRSDTHDVWLHTADDVTHYAEYSANGTSWAAFTSALTANVTNFKDLILNNLAQDQQQFMYGGDYIYAAVRDTSNNTTFVRSADLTSGAVTDNWGTSFLPNNPDASSLSAWGTGNGRILYIFQDGSFNWRLERCNHGTQAWTLVTGNLPKHTSGVLPFSIVYGAGKFVAMNSQGKILHVSAGGELTVGNWTKADTQITTDGYTVQGCRFSADAGANTGQFVAWTQDGLGSAGTCRIYTSPDGITWTLRKTFSSRALSSRMEPKYTLDGADLD